MKTRRSNKLLVEPASAASGDIAFNLIIFFLVCASSQPDSGRRQEIPRADAKQQKEEKNENVEVQLKRQGVLINGDAVAMNEFIPRIKAKLDVKPKDARIVVVKSDPDVSYNHWIGVTSQIETAGGIITLEIKQDQEVEVPNS